MNKIAIVVGVSCSGKDFLLDQLPKSFTLPVVNFGSELFLELRKQFPGLSSRDEVRWLGSDSITEAVLKVAQKMVEDQPLIISSHLVPKTEDGFAAKPGSHWILDPAVYVHVSAPPEEILERRWRNERSRRELSETLEEVKTHQEFSESLAEQFAVSSGAAFYRVVNQRGCLCSVRNLVNALEILV